MSQQQARFELSRDIERYLAALSKLYAQDGKRTQQEIIVNAQIRVHEEWSYDRWDGGIYGHGLFLTIPSALFLRVVEQKDQLQDELKSDINKLHNVRAEFIAAVFIEMELASDTDWRRESGLLLPVERSVPTDVLTRIWGEGGFRLFLSHRASAKKRTSELKERLALFGFAAFVAHSDIQPTKAWQEEIENALASMDGLVALMTKDFHESEWTDQEVGYAFARGVPIVAVRLGLDPYGFIGKFQGVATTWDKAALDITKVLVQSDRGLAAYIAALRHCPSWNDANTLADVLPAILKLTERQVDDLISTYNETSELRGGWGFNGSRPGSYGPGLVYYLNSRGHRKFQCNSDGLIVASETSKR